MSVSNHTLSFQRNDAFVKPKNYKRVDELKIPSKLESKVASSVEKTISSLELISTRLNTKEYSDIFKKTAKVLKRASKETNLREKSELLVAQFLAFKVYDVYTKNHPGQDNLIHALEEKYNLTGEQLDRFLMLLTTDEAKTMTPEFVEQSKFLKKLKKNYADEWVIAP